MLHTFAARPARARRLVGCPVVLLLMAIAALAHAGTTGSQPAERPAVGAGGPSCFGAAARETGRRCDDARLQRMVVPSPRQARRLPNSPCAPFERARHMNVCAFGTDEDEATATVALVGDSHAGHWRGALDVVARHKGWRGLSITRTSCPLSKAVRNLPDPARFRECARWKDAVLAWFTRHPEVRTAFVSGLSGGAGVLPRGGRGRFESAVEGYMEAWRGLPSTVEQVVVIRDTPKMRGPVDPCLERALARSRPAGTTCAVPRRRALDRDPLAVAAERMRSPRVRTVDLTRFFCGGRRCYPVVGGALVLRDQNHMTAVFSATLGPYLLREVDRAPAVPATATAAVAAAHPCFGAAARDPRRSCPSALSRVAVAPRPSVARKLPPAPCISTHVEGALSLCTFGVPPARARRTIALVGDSHAAHWRAALDATARVEGWHGISVMLGGCPLSSALRALRPPSRRDACQEWKRQVLEWFPRHPEVSLVFVGALSGGSGVVPAAGRSEFETSAAGYRAAWAALPPSVERIVALRDTPKMRGLVNACVRHAIAARRPPAMRCSVPRASAFDPDAMLAAARQMRSRRVSVADLTRFLCDRRRCYPVVGGALAFKDSTHLTPVFAATLGPFLRRAVDQMLRPQPNAAL